MSSEIVRDDLNIWWRHLFIRAVNVSMKQPNWGIGLLANIILHYKQVSLRLSVYVHVGMFCIKFKTNFFAHTVCT